MYESNALVPESANFQLIQLFHLTQPPSQVRQCHQNRGMIPKNLEYTWVCFSIEDDAKIWLTFISSFWECGPLNFNIMLTTDKQRIYLEQQFNRSFVKLTLTAHIPALVGWYIAILFHWIFLDQPSTVRQPAVLPLFDDYPYLERKKNGRRRKIYYLNIRQCSICWGSWGFNRPLVPLDP